MEVDLFQIDVTASRWDVMRAFASVFHDNPGSDWFTPVQNDPIPRKLNFQVVLGEGPGGVRNNGKGTLTLPSRGVWQKLLRWLMEPGNEIRVGEKAIKMKPARTSPRFDLKMTLQKAPYIDPDNEERLLEITSSLDRSLHIDEIQFGVFLEPKRRPGPRIFSIEYCDDYRRRRATLKFEWKPRLIRLTVRFRQCSHSQLLNYPHSLVMT
jgi:RNA-dependent RNA polymerase